MSMRSIKTKPKTIDEYLALAKPEQRAVLEKLRKTIHAAAPGAVEYIGYGLAGFKFNKRPLVYFGAWENHCALYAASPAMQKRFQKELAAAAAAVNAAEVAPPAPPDGGAQAAISPAGIRLKVLDRETSRPLAGVRVIATNLGKALGESVTDGNGGCELPRPVPVAGDFYFRIGLCTSLKPAQSFVALATGTPQPVGVTGVKCIVLLFNCKM
jgi:uncharacterized protein YdhG (YjbR/CyaY superfamily)